MRSLERAEATLCAPSAGGSEIAKTAHYDIIIRGGLVVDGTGAEPKQADVAISKGLIQAVGTIDGTAAEEIDAAGLLVTEGVIRKALKARITRADVIIYQGEINSLRRFKDDVAEVRAGLECGVTFTQNFTDIKPGDVLETYEVEMRERTL